MSEHTYVGVWRSFGGRKSPGVPFPIEVRFGDHPRDALSIRQARTLIRQLERTIVEVKRLQARK